MEQMKKQIETKEVIWIGVRIFLILGFVVLAFFQMGFHERWADEAQAWLLARDASFFDLIFKYASLEGSTMLWHIILKVCISLGLNYSWYGMIPIIATVIGLVILEFKLKVPWYIKLLLPFTYYIFYQYTTIARSYCLIFPTLCYLAMIYPKKMERPISYGIGLVILAGISLHGCLLSGMLFLMYFFEYAEKRLNEDKKIRSLFKEKKIWITLLIIAIIYCFIIITVYPKAGVPKFGTNYNVNKIEKTFQIIGESFISTNEGNSVLNVFSTIVALGITVILLGRAERDKKIVFILIPLLAFLVFIYGNQWHIGTFTEAVFFVWYILSIDQKEHKKNILNIILLIGIITILVIQITWSINSYIYDKNNYYAHGESVANYLKQSVEEGKTIYGIDYSVTAILPYFDENIFANYLQKEKSFFEWINMGQRIEGNKEIIAAEADVYIISMWYLLNRVEVLDYLKQSEYQVKVFDSRTFIKDDIYEISGYLVFEK